MTNTRYPTAKEQMESGKWVFIHSQNKGIVGISYYAERIGDRYSVEYINQSSLIGVPALYFIFGMCVVLTKIFNIIGGGTGDDLFKDIIAECKELLMARNHNESIGRAYSLHNKYESLEECVNAAKKDFKSKIIKSK